MVAAEALGALLGNHIDWSRVSSEHPEYVNPSDFWNSVIRWQMRTSGPGSPASISWAIWRTLSFSDLNLRFGLLLFKDGVLNCAQDSRWL